MRMGEWWYIRMQYFVTALDGREWPDSRPGRFIPEERTSGTLSIGLRTDLDFVKKRILQGIELRLLVYPHHNLVTVLTELIQLINEVSTLQY
jgi:hypothetical protein